MRLWATIFISGLFLLNPSRALASVIEWNFYPALVNFGLTPAVGGGRFSITIVDHVRFFTGATPFETDIRGEVDFSTGSLLDVTLFNNQSGTLTRSLYRYAPGELTVNAKWNIPGGTQTGTFVAPLLDLSLDVAEDCPFPRCAQASMRAVLGPGAFDPLLAHALGITGYSTGGSVVAHVDRIDGTPASATRLGGAASEWTVDVNVPEPSASVLIAMTITAICARRRHIVSRLRR